MYDNKSVITTMAILCFVWAIFYICIAINYLITKWRIKHNKIREIECTYRVISIHAVKDTRNSYPIAYVSVIKLEYNLNDKYITNEMISYNDYGVIGTIGNINIYTDKDGNFIKVNDIKESKNTIRLLLTYSICLIVIIICLLV